MKKIIIVLIVLLIKFSSCGDVFVHYSLNVDNQTRDTIKIVFLDNSPYKMVNPDSLYFPPKHKKLLYGASGRVIEDGCYTGIKEKEIKVYTSSGRELRKDIWNVNNWECRGAKMEGWNMTFVITEYDLE